jgi:curved DNA-binding protein CbpA
MMDYYSLLGIPRDASIDQIRAAYRKAIKKWHPDLNRDNVTLSSLMTSQLNEAYHVLINPSERQKYDLTLDVNVSKAIENDKVKYSYVRNETKTNNASRLKEVERVESWKNAFFSYMARHQWASSLYTDLPEKVKTRIFSGSYEMKDIVYLYIKIEEAKISKGLSSAYFNFQQLNKIKEDMNVSTDIVFKKLSSLEIILQFYIRIKSGLIQSSTVNTYEQNVVKKFVQVHKYLIRHPDDLFQAIEKFKVSQNDWDTAKEFIR